MAAFEVRLVAVGAEDVGVVEPSRGRFGLLADARAFCEAFFAQSRTPAHRHTGIALHTPASVHFGTASQVRQQHQATLLRRETQSVPAPPARTAQASDAAWINQPSGEALVQSN